MDLLLSNFNLKVGDLDKLISLDNSIRILLRSSCINGSFKQGKQSIKIASGLGKVRFSGIYYLSGYEGNKS